MGSIPTEVKKIFSLPRVVPCFPLLGLTPSGLYMGLSSTLIYTSELILCSTLYFNQSRPVMVVKRMFGEERFTVFYFRLMRFILDLCF